jgi:hypothetical protein
MRINTMERYIPDERYRAHALYATHQTSRHWLDVLVASPIYVAVGMLGALAFLWFIGGR